MTGRPPRLAERLVARLFADPEWRDAVLGDLAEEYADAAARHGATAARWGCPASSTE